MVILCLSGMSNVSFDGEAASCESDHEQGSENIIRTDGASFYYC